MLCGNLAEKTEKRAFHHIARHLAELVPDHTFEGLREKREPQRGVSVHAPKRKTDGAIRVIDRAVKIIYVHILTFSKTLLT